MCYSEYFHAPIYSSGRRTLLFRPEDGGFYGPTDQNKEGRPAIRSKSRPSPSYYRKAQLQAEAPDLIIDEFRELFAHLGKKEAR